MSHSFEKNTVHLIETCIFALISIMTIQSSRRSKNKISCGIYAGRGVTGASDTLLSVYLINIVFDETDIDKTVLE